MLRGIKGTYVYVCDTELRKYFSKFIPRVNETRFENTQRDSEYDKKLTISPYAKNLVSIPLYDSVGCGEFMYADSVNHETIEVPGWLIKPGAKYFALRTSGDSMDQLGIKHGDIILCQKNYQPSSGSNAVILIGDDATLKQIKFEKNALVLIPKSNNPTHKITRITAEDDDFKILGVFVCKL